MPPDDGRPFQECSINVFASSVSNELVFQMSVEGTSYESPEFSPDGQWLAYVEKTDGRSNLRLVRTDNWEDDHPLTEPFKLGYTLQNLFWSFDSQWIAFEEYNWGARYGTTYIVNIVTGEVKAVGEAIGNAFAWSPSERSQFAFAIGEGPSSWGGIYLANTDTPQDGTLLEGTQEAFDEGSNPFFLNWHPQDPLLVMCIDKLPETGLSSRTELWLFEFSSNEWMLIDTFGKYDCAGIDWSPDGQTLAVFSSISIRFYESPDWQVSRSFSAFRTLTEMTEGSPWSGNWVSDSVFVFSLAGLQPPPSLHVHDLFAMSSTVPQPPFGMWNINVQDLPVQFDLIDEIAWYYNDPP